MGRCRTAHRAGFAALLLWSAASSGTTLDLCAAAGKIGTRADQNDPCERLSLLAEVASKCAAEMPEDRQLQRHAAGILQLEKQLQIDQSVMQSLRQMRDAPTASTGPMHLDPSALDRQIAFQESAGEKNRAALAARRTVAVSAGYPMLAQAGFAQAVITNAVWRHVESWTAPQATNCRNSENEGTSAGQLAGMIAVLLSHGNPIETQVMRQLLADPPVGH